AIVDDGHVKTERRAQRGQRLRDMTGAGDHQPLRARNGIEEQPRPLAIDAGHRIGAAVVADLDERRSPIAGSRHELRHRTRWNLESAGQSTLLGCRVDDRLRTDRSRVNSMHQRQQRGRPIARSGAGELPRGLQVGSGHPDVDEYIHDAATSPNLLLIEVPGQIDLGEPRTPSLIEEETSLAKNLCLAASSADGAELAVLTHYHLGADLSGSRSAHVDNRREGELLSAFEGPLGLGPNLVRPHHDLKLSENGAR